MNGALTVAGLEVRLGFRNRWVLATTLLMAVLALSIAMLGQSPAGNIDADPLIVAIVSLASLTIFLIPLMALLLSYDAIVGEVDQGTMLLLLSYPVSRTAVVLGKFFGQTTIIGLATLLGYGLAGIIVAFSQESGASAEGWIALAKLIVSAILMGAAFVGLGLACSSFTRQRGAAAGLAVSLWLLFVIVFDLLLLGALVSGFDSVISEGAFPMMLLANPADVFRMLNMELVAGSGLVSGFAKVSANASIATAGLWGALLLWSVSPLAVAVLFFKRSDI